MFLIFLIFFCYWYDLFSLFLFYPHHDQENQEWSPPIGGEWLPMFLSAVRSLKGAGERRREGGWVSATRSCTTISSLFSSPSSSLAWFSLFFPHHLCHWVKARVGLGTGSWVSATRTNRTRSSLFRHHSPPQLAVDYNFEAKRGGRIVEWLQQGPAAQTDPPTSRHLSPPTVGKRLKLWG